MEHYMNYLYSFSLLHLQVPNKGALDKYNIIPLNYFQKSWDFYTLRSVGMNNECMLSFVLLIDLLLKKYEIWTFSIF